jgi:hypothetical protein
MKGIMLFSFVILLLILGQTPCDTISRKLPTGVSLNLGPSVPEENISAEQMVLPENTISESDSFIEADLEFEEWMMNPKQFNL